MCHEKFLGVLGHSTFFHVSEVREHTCLSPADCRRASSLARHPPLPASTPVAELAAGVQSLLRIMTSRGYALDVRLSSFKGVKQGCGR